MIAALLTRLRDSRLTWDLFGHLYNRHVLQALEKLFVHLAGAIVDGRNARILEVGAGHGRLALLIAELNPSSTVTGVDFSLMQVRAARRLQAATRIPNCRFVKADAMRLPFETGTFDVALSVGSIKHWPDGLRGVCEMARVLRPGGLLIVSETDPCASRLEIGLFAKGFRSWYLANGLALWFLEHVVFGHEYQAERLVSLCRQAGVEASESARVEGIPYVIVAGVKRP
ncbi:MAG TPA: class I SAM-dependent methyltransferase [Deltaproteobacteria bacterium]|nr:class I SAM-dependent methyltransferase [Deltaproteobacteria bacterium]HPP80593.1 class I SAM-dependent methyltransferase [Deltaproteobacteria bacterium]